MNPVIIVPTFVSSHKQRKSTNPVARYDHTTRLSQKGELPRLLDSLEKVEDLGSIIVLVASDRGTEDAAAEKVQAILNSYPTLNTILIGETELKILRSYFEAMNLASVRNEVSLTGYGAIRNLGLVLAQIFGFDAVVFLDDDEVVDDPKFLHQAMYGLGKLTKSGIPILAKTGYYLNADGEYKSRRNNHWYDKFWQQSKAFNEWIVSAMAGPRLSRSNHVCGGCLALHQEAFKRLSFDAWIPRGEDLDYLLNLRMYGSDIWFDNKWYLHHLPPATDSEGERFRQDIIRWFYEYRKMEYSKTQIDLMQIKPKSLEPYPGPFLESGIKRRIRFTAYMRSLARPDKKAYRKAARIVTGEASNYSEENCMKYFEFQYIWSELMARIAGNEQIAAAIVNSSYERAVLIHKKQVRDYERSAPPQAKKKSIDPGLTSEIQLNLDE